MDPSRINTVDLRSLRLTLFPLPPSSLYAQRWSTRYASHTYPLGLPSWNRALFPRLCPAVAMSKFRSQQRKKPTRSLASERPWQADIPFGPPHIPSSPGNGIDRLRNTLSKLSPAARAERELLKQKSRYKNPLTERNVNTLVSQQEVMDACYPTDHSTELQVTIWLERMN